MIQSRSLRYDEQINRLESLTPILLAMHGAAMLLTLGGNPGSWVLVIITALLGATVAIQSWTQKKLAALRAAGLMGISLALLFSTEDSNRFFLPWFFAIVSIYPIVLNPPFRVLLPFVMAGIYLTMLLFPPREQSIVAVWAHSFLLLYIGLLTGKLGSILNEQAANRDALIQEASDGIFITDLDGNFIEINQAGCSMFGCTRDEILRRNIRDVIILEAGEEPLQLAELLAGHIIRTERLLRRKDGTQFPAELSGRRITGDRIQGIVRDITERRRDEAAQQQLINWQKRLIETSPDGIVENDLNGKILNMNSRFAELFGFESAAEILSSGLSTFDLLAQEEKDAVPEKAQPVFDVGVVRNVEMKVVRRDGTVFEAEFSTTMMDGEGNDSRTLITFIRDITERKQTEAALQAAEAKYRALVERLPAVVYTSDLGTTGAWHYVSPQIESLLGFTPEEWIADPGLWYQRVHVDDRERQETLEEQALESG
ncbi:MAG TPA: PAS domain S-box protein, partial [Anaerolineales bacterium]|nr:PAS domain S-box protein [Anaerolineales bacterium]